MLGGWSDTPPYCLERGGSVLNGAFSLNGKKPIRVIIEKNELNTILIRSNDLNVEKEFTNINELIECSNTNDMFSLPKASLIISGIISTKDKNVNDVIKRLGTGITLTTDVISIPKGSGLGTSSILAAACLKAIYKFINVKVSNEFICQKVLEQEQLMGTGGGWQDQIGGIIPGIKLTSTEAGIQQDFNIKKIPVSHNIYNMFNDRYALIYTGQRRLAKNLLRNIMNSYILGKKEVVESIDKIKDISIKMAEALANLDIKHFSKLLNEHWEYSKKLDAGCTNNCINQILSACEDLIDAKMICGAGGGGFLQVLLKENVSKKQLIDRIEQIFQDSGTSVYDISLIQEEI